ncbi:hypothetical protein CROQUDRAFT_109854 [Cronartium quercuum f. sp. fusiforme G11]|uniref:Uncharacterized protein n=1 Tax=Cronartium quercuum f. sp. fusiforme G11 TaxID=708437 RepID=A0A9P6NF04_9BASI|nr:hypothetical protein CROQUDRAFT_109854 [Cronartium quercuum f. sp. fusiforme G11]
MSSKRASKNMTWSPDILSKIPLPCTHWFLPIRPDHNTSQFYDGNLQEKVVKPDTMFLNVGGTVALHSRQKRPKSIFLLSLTLLISLPGLGARPQNSNSLDRELFPQISNILGVEVEPEPELKGRETENVSEQITRTLPSSIKNPAQFQEPLKNSSASLLIPGTTPSPTRVPSPEPSSAPSTLPPTTHDESNPPASEGDNSDGRDLSPGAIAAIVICSFIGFFGLLAILGMALRSVQNSVENEKELKRAKQARQSGIANRAAETREAQV